MGGFAMSIIKCPECGKDISDKAAACIYCGYPINKVAESELSESSAPNNEEQAPNPVTDIPTAATSDQASEKNESLWSIARKPTLAPGGFR